MISIFCRFLATPSLVPDKPTTNSKEETSIHKFTITRLAQCVQVCGDTESKMYLDADSFT